MKKILMTSVLVLGLGIQQVACDSTNQSVLNVQQEVEALIAHAQYNNLSDVEILDLARQAVDQAAHFDDFGIEVKQDNHQKMLIIAGVVVVVVVAAGVAYHFYKKKSDSDSRTSRAAHKFAEELVKKAVAGLSVDEITACADIKKMDGSLEEKAHFLRARERVEKAGQAAGMKAFWNGTLGNREVFARNYMQAHLVKAVDESYLTKLEEADLERARRAL
ncbi:hypothetical protein K2X40_02460 [Candidatus Babeliales bacterium]|nr:hypothetical protein [Candidatus Babeliales bacterium]